MGPKEEEKASEDEFEAPPQPVVPEGLVEPRPASEAGAGASVEATQAETTVEAPAPSAGEAGVRPTAPGTAGGPQGVPSSHKKATPGARYILDFCSFFFIFLFLLICIASSVGSKRLRRWRWPP